MKLKTKNKKAVELLGEHTVNLVIAVLSIVVLIFLGFAVYNLILGDKTEDVKAKAELDNMMDKIKILQDKNGGTLNHIVLGPEGWAIVGWPIANGLSADYCLLKGWTNCLCFCDLDFTDVGRAYWKRLTPEATREMCDKKPFCAEITAKDFQVNPTDSAILAFLNLASKHKPIIMDELMKIYIGNLNITYDKTKDKLTIIPLKK